MMEENVRNQTSNSTSCSDRDANANKVASLIWEICNAKLSSERTRNWTHEKKRIGLLVGQQQSEILTADNHREQNKILVCCCSLCTEAIGEIADHLRFNVVRELSLLGFSYLGSALCNSQWTIVYKPGFYASCAVFERRGMRGLLKKMKFQHLDWDFLLRSFFSKKETDWVSFFIFLGFSLDILNFGLHVFPPLVHLFQSVYALHVYVFSFSWTTFSWGEGEYPAMVQKCRIYH